MKKLYFILLGALLAACFSTYFISTLRGDLVPLSDEDAGLREELVWYLGQLDVDYDMPGTSVEIKINAIKEGEQPLHVGFDEGDYYFVCAYYNGPHEYESFVFCCAEEYTWMKCDTAEEILEVCYAGKLIATFQINTSSFARDILSETQTVSKMEHYQMYKPEFSSGANIKDALSFETSFIYLNSSPEKETVYHSTRRYDHDWVTLPCIQLEQDVYISTLWRVKYSNGTWYDHNLHYEFGKYYDGLVEAMETGKYSVKYNSGPEYFYGLISIEDLVDVLKQ